MLDKNKLKPNDTWKAYLNRQSSVFALVLTVLELLYDETLVGSAVAIIYWVPVCLLLTGRTRWIHSCPPGRFPALTLAQGGTGGVGGVRGERRTGLSCQGCRLLGLLHVDRGALDMMDDHRRGRHHLGFDGGALGLQRG